MTHDYDPQAVVEQERNRVHGETLAALCKMTERLQEAQKHADNLASELVMGNDTLRAVIRQRDEALSLVRQLERYIMGPVPDEIAEKEFNVDETLGTALQEQVETIQAWRIKNARSVFTKEATDG